MDLHADSDTERTEGYAPFELVRATGGAPTSLVFCSPHSGTFYPDDMGACVGHARLRSVEDAAVDRLIACGADHGASLLLARFGRAYVDLNRAESDLDPSLIADCPIKRPGPKTVAGYGVLHRNSSDGQALYDRRLTMAEVETRLARVHRPYHRQLSDLMHSARLQTGRAILIDWHSMPERATGPHGPDIVLGDRHGSSCAALWTRTLRMLFEQQGWRVGLNRPYAGGYATQLWGQPEEDFHAVQIEVNRRLYWDEAAHTPGEGWKRTQSALKRVIAEFCDAAAPEIPRAG
ncbi:MULTISPECIES: N-formylglutamate amidohydrolase [unclassified Brevundimonas]|uniref:N-formylglutamate amidohydrolase n=1 Tax=unclassified Brevundimonas TaxID=2622653 RepID=UPI0025C1E27F|nr:MULTISPECIES: N-formylglutamate amidohydrolase [unclassified Brevundimonas]